MPLQVHGAPTAAATHDFSDARLLNYSHKPAVIPFLQRFHRPLYSISRAPPTVSLHYLPSTVAFEPIDISSRKAWSNRSAQLAPGVFSSSNRPPTGAADDDSQDTPAPQLYRKSKHRNSSGLGNTNSNSSGIEGGRVNGNSWATPDPPPSDGSHSSTSPQQQEPPEADQQQQEHRKQVLLQYSQASTQALQTLSALVDRISGNGSSGIPQPPSLYRRHSQPPPALHATTAKADIPAVTAHLVLTLQPYLRTLLLPELAAVATALTDLRQPCPNELWGEEFVDACGVLLQELVLKPQQQQHCSPTEQQQQQQEPTGDLSMQGNLHRQPFHLSAEQNSPSIQLEAEHLADSPAAQVVALLRALRHLKLRPQQQWLEAAEALLLAPGHGLQELGADSAVIVLETVAELSLLPSQRLLSSALSATADALPSLAPNRLLSLLSAVAQLGIPPGPAFLSTAFHLLTAHISHMGISQLQPLLQTAAGLLLPRREDEAGSMGRRGTWEAPQLGMSGALAAGAADVIPWPFWAAVFHTSGSSAALAQLRTAEVSALLVAVSKLQPQPPQQWLDAVLARYATTVRTDVTGVLTASLDALARCGARTLPAVFRSQVLLRLQHRSVLHTLKPLHFAQLLSAVDQLQIPVDPSLASALLQQLHSVLPEYRPGPPLVNTLAFLHVLLEPQAAAQLQEDQQMQAFSQTFRGDATAVAGSSHWSTSTDRAPHSSFLSSGDSADSQRKPVASLSPELRMSLLSALYCSLRKYNASDLTSVLSSLVKLGIIPDVAWLNEYLIAARGVLHHFEGQQLAVMLWALASCRAAPTSRWIEPVLAHASGRLAALQPRYLAMLLWGLAKMGTLPDAHWMGHALERSSAAFRSSDATSLSLTIWALARIGFRPSSTWLGQFCDATAARMGTASAHSLSVSLWALVVKLGHAPPQAWMEAWLQAVAERAGSTFSTQDISNCATALARLQTLASFRPHEAWLSHFCSTSARVISRRISQLQQGAENSSPTLQWAGARDAGSQQAVLVQEVCKHAAVLTHGLASMQLVSPAFGSTLLPTLTPLLQVASPGALAMMVSACVKLKAANQLSPDMSQELVAAALRGGAKVLSNADSHSLTSLHWALAKLGTDPGDKWWKLLEGTIMWRVEHSSKYDSSTSDSYFSPPSQPSSASSDSAMSDPSQLALSPSQQQQEERFGLTSRCRSTLLYALATLTTTPGSSDGGGRRGAMKRSLPSISHSNRDYLRDAAPRATTVVKDGDLAKQHLGSEGAPSAQIITPLEERATRRLRQHSLVRLLLPPIQQLPHCSAQDLAMTIWALPRLLHWAPLLWQNAFVAHACSQATLASYSPEGLTMLAWGLASLQHRVKPGMAAAFVTAAALAGSGKDEGQSMQLVVLPHTTRGESASDFDKTFTVPPPQQLISTQLSLQAFSPHNLSLLLWSLARWGHASALDPLLPAALSASRSHMLAQQQTGAGVSRMLWSMATLYGKVQHCGAVCSPAQVAESKRWARRAGRTTRRLRSRLHLSTTTTTTNPVVVTRMRRRRARLLQQMEVRKQGQPLYRDVRDARRPHTTDGRASPVCSDSAWVAAGSGVTSPWLAAAASELIRTSHSLSMHRVAVGLWALALLGFAPDLAWVSIAEVVVESRRSELGISILSTCMAAATQLGLDVTGGGPSSDPTGGKAVAGQAFAAKRPSKRAGSAAGKEGLQRGARTAASGVRADVGSAATDLSSRPILSEAPSRRRPLFDSESNLST